MFGPGDGGVEPAVVLFGAATEALVKDDDRAEGGSLGLVTGDRVAPAALDETAARCPFMTVTVRVKDNMVVIFAAPELLLARDRETVIGLDFGTEGTRIMRMRSHVGEL